MRKLNFDSLDEYESSAIAMKRLLIRLFAFVFFTFIIALVLTHSFIEHGRVVIMLIIMFPLVLMLSGIVVGLTIGNYKSR